MTQTDAVMPAVAKRAGFFRRAAATGTDVFTGLIGSFMVLSLLGLTIPMDSPRMAVLTRPVMFFGFLYIGIAPYLFTNSLGKYAFAVRVVSEVTRTKPSLWQFLARWALLIVWPVEVAMLLFSRSKKRIGDRLAATMVIEDAATKNRWGRRIGISLTALFLLYFALVQTMQASARNTGLFHAASAFLQENRIGEEALGDPVSPSNTPLTVVMKKDKGEVIVSASGARQSGYIEMKLARREDRWQVTDWKITDQPTARGYSYSY